MMQQGWTGPEGGKKSWRISGSSIILLLLLSAALSRLRSLNYDAPLRPTDYTPALLPHVLSDFDPFLRSPCSPPSRIPLSHSRSRLNVLD